MSLPPFALPENGRVVDLQTGELQAGGFDELLAVVFAPALAEERTDERFSEAGVPDARSASLGKSAISHRVREKLICSVYADMVQVGQVERGDDGGEDDRRPAAGGGKRGAVMGFSRRSRSRMMQECAKVRNVENGFFLTLTFPDLVVSAFESVEDMAAWAKGCWDVVLKRLRRQFKRCGGIWRMELQDRKSGDFTGLLVPHFHVIFFCGERVPLMMVQDELRAHWAEVVGLDDAAFIEHGTLAWAINNRRHVMSYASKYAAKVEGDDVAAGRRWGRFGNLDQSEALRVELNPEQVVQFKRYQRALLRARGGHHYAKVLARLPAEFGGYLLGLGDASAAEGWHGHEPTVFIMLRAVGVEV